MLLSSGAFDRGTESGRRRVGEESRPLSVRDGRARVSVRSIYYRYISDQSGRTQA